MRWYCGWIYARAATGGTFRHMLPAADARGRRPTECLLTRCFAALNSAADPAKPLLTSPQASHHRPALHAHGCSSRQRGSVPAFPVCRFSCSVCLSAADRQIVAVQAGRNCSHRSCCNYLVLGCREHWCAGTAAGYMHALQQEVPFGTCCLLLTQGGDGRLSAS